ncbi:MAG: hypothetical protein H0V09_03285 [Gemmatimonadetes bacterium]|nr:hypothetical protein [Gemmatimonadota bacterium]
MRTLATLLFATSVWLAGSGLEAQYSPRIADGREFGGEVRVGDKAVSLAGIFQTAIGIRTDARAGLGIVNPDEGDSEIFLTGGLRTLLSSAGRRLPLDVALDGQLDLLLLEDTILVLSGGPSFGRAVGPARALTPYAQPVLAIASGSGESETDVLLRLGADYEITETVDVRGSLDIGDDTELRGALFFQF